MIRGFCCQTTPSISKLFDAADESLLKTVLSDSYHVLHCLLPENQTVSYTLMSRSHNLTLTRRSNLYDDCNFITRMNFSNVFACHSAVGYTVCHCLIKRIFLNFYLYLVHHCTKSIVAPSSTLTDSYVILSFL